MLRVMSYCSLGLMPATAWDQSLGLFRMSAARAEVTRAGRRHPSGALAGGDGFSGVWLIENDLA